MSLSPCQTLTRSVQINIALVMTSDSVWLLWFLSGCYAAGHQCCMSKTDVLYVVVLGG